jgi:YidC/Oxa1 family membrane protein insertase
MWDLILNPFVTLLTWMYSIFNNEIVIAIVVFTILVRLITFPLLAKTQQSSKRMQELQPRIKKMQEKYKGREKEPEIREKMAAEQMAIYREAGVSPVGGCLPSLIQIPIMLALYQAIYFALATSPYQLVDLADRLLIPGLDQLLLLKNTWLGMNLTQPPAPPLNPTYALVLPVLVMITTYFQSKLAMPATTPSTDGEVSQTEAINRSMTTVMPIMLGVFALSFSVGISIYFITGNLISILQYSPIGKRMTERVFSSGKPKNEEDPDDSAPLTRKPVAVTASGSAANSSSINKKTKKKIRR